MRGEMVMRAVSQPQHGHFAYIWHICHILAYTGLLHECILWGWRRLHQTWCSVTMQRSRKTCWGRPKWVKNELQNMQVPVAYIKRYYYSNKISRETWPQRCLLEVLQAQGGVGKMSPIPLQLMQSIWNNLPRCNLLWLVTVDIIDLGHSDWWSIGASAIVFLLMGSPPWFTFPMHREHNLALCTANGSGLKDVYKIWGLWSGWGRLGSRIIPPWGSFSHSKSPGP